MTSPSIKTSIIIPARNAMATLPQAIESVMKVVNDEDVEIIIVNDGLDEATAQLADRYPVKVVDGNGNGIAAARNIGIQSSSGEILILLDADCYVSLKWLISHLETHKYHNELLAVGGAICLFPHENFWARCDHYCSWYNVHPYHRESWVPNHPGANLSFSRSTYERVGPFKENLPRDGVHEDIEWQVRLLGLGGRVRFQPQAVVQHVDRDDLKGYLKHNYQWGYNSIEIKAGSRISRFPWVYERPWALITGLLPFAVGHTIYTIVCWLKGGKLEPLFLSPFIFIGRLAYAIGMANGGIRFLWKRKTRVKENAC